MSLWVLSGRLSSRQGHRDCAAEIFTTHDYVRKVAPGFGRFSGDNNNDNDKEKDEEMDPLCFDNDNDDDDANDNNEDVGSSSSNCSSSSSSSRGWREVTNGMKKYPVWQLLKWYDIIYNYLKYF